MSNIGLSFDFKEVNSMLRNKSLSELKEGLSYLLLNYAELIEDKNIHEFIADNHRIKVCFRYACVYQAYRDGRRYA